MIFSGLPECLLKRLQFVQNCAAKLVLGRQKFDSSREALAELHWLPIRVHVLILRFLHWFIGAYQVMPLEYLKKLLTILKLNCEGLRSTATVRKLLIPRTKHAKPSQTDHLVFMHLNVGMHYQMG